MTEKTAALWVINLNLNNVRMNSTQFIQNEIKPMPYSYYTEALYKNTHRTRGRIL